jgi:hypothetical protein
LRYFMISTSSCARSFSFCTGIFHGLLNKTMEPLFCSAEFYWCFQPGAWIA